MLLCISACVCLTARAQHEGRGMKPSPQSPAVSSKTPPAQLTQPFRPFIEFGTRTFSRSDRRDLRVISDQIRFVFTNGALYLEYGGQGMPALLPVSGGGASGCFKRDPDFILQPILRWKPSEASLRRE